MKHPKLVLLRHGQSEWNKKKLFTGWIDIPLSPSGIEEAYKAGKRLSGIDFGAIYMSTLIRSQMTAMLAMSVHPTEKIPAVIHSAQEPHGSWYDPKGAHGILPVYTAWELNERMYGDLQGLNKDETRAKFGDEQVKLWRRSFDTPPPHGESLKMTAARTLPYFEKEIVPHLKKGMNILVCSHGNSLRSIAMELEGLSEAEVLALEIPTGEPLCYAYDNGKWIKESL